MLLQAHAQLVCIFRVPRASHKCRDSAVRIYISSVESLNAPVASPAFVFTGCVLYAIRRVVFSRLRPSRSHRLASALRVYRGAPKSLGGVAEGQCATTIRSLAGDCPTGARVHGCTVHGVRPPGISAQMPKDYLRYVIRFVRPMSGTYPLYRIAVERAGFAMSYQSEILEIFPRSGGLRPQVNGVSTRHAVSRVRASKHVPYPNLLHPGSESR